MYCNEGIWLCWRAEWPSPSYVDDSLMSWENRPHIAVFGPFYKSWHSSTVLLLYSEITLGLHSWPQIDLSRYKLPTSPRSKCCQLTPWDFVPTFQYMADSCEHAVESDLRRSCGRVWQLTHWRMFSNSLLGWTWQVPRDMCSDLHIGNQL